MGAPRRYGPARVRGELRHPHARRGCFVPSDRSRAGLVGVRVRLSGTADLRVGFGPSPGDPHLHHRLHVRRSLRVRQSAAECPERRMAWYGGVAYPRRCHVPRGSHGHDGARALPLRIRHCPSVLPPTIRYHTGDGTYPRARPLGHVFSGRPPDVEAGRGRRPDAGSDGGAQRLRSRKVFRHTDIHDGHLPGVVPAERPDRGNAPVRDPAPVCLHAHRLRAHPAWAGALR